MTVKQRKIYISLNPTFLSPSALALHQLGDHGLPYFMSNKMQSNKCHTEFRDVFCKLLWSESSATVHGLPDGVTYEEGALMEPLSVAVHACRRAQVHMGQRILVQGAGPIGTLCMMTAKAAGAAQIVITDLNSVRLELVKKLGAEHTICVE
ncbi:hypothetical protein ANCCAN_04677 [Ancylostoma caninum]|uniref:Alcohol dehydrogenase-like C-terminal domain-containing protein n=1 Tax=Ancylostoma caninum TaxID=29170 RepID=A0A368GY23_ANCCA|nr:hypothetical protein ANCCAN_04677 [Ancylostoma caninum]